ncbi:MULTISPECIES: DUF7948 domain-containing protein [unclassified Microcoleus]|uniref:DUF7948 domain-containing protein n=1 Tax=unclassified Microcoleus TaxID=2642155 RepID=UPI002FD4A59B
MNAQNQQSSYGQIPLSFIANNGQTDPSVKFQVKGAGHSIFFSPNEISFTAFSTPTEPGNPATATSATVRSSLANSNRNPTISGLQQLPGVANFLLGEDSSQWHTNVPTFNGVVYQNVYQGIDRVFKGTEGQLKSEFLVAPLADPSQIRMNYNGVSDIRLRDDGALILETPLGELIDNAPIVYQDINGTRVNVPAAYNLLGNGQVGFTLGDFDRTQPLVIDPVLAYSTYLGGSGSEGANRLAVDSTGAAYIIGSTNNNFITTPGAFQTTPAGQADFLVTKINPEGTALVYSTYIGGAGNEYGLGIAVDSQGNAYLTGQVDPGFPTTPGSFQPTAPNYTAAVTKLNAAGNALVYSTFLGTSSSGALGNGIAVDSSGNAYVTGLTGDGFPTTPGASQPTSGGDIDAFITKVNPTGSALVYSTYLGGSAREDAQAIAIDNNGNAYITGLTYSTDLPGVDLGFQNALLGQYDGFVGKFDANGARAYSTYLGGSGDDKGADIAVDSSGNAYVVGITTSTDFPTKNAIQAANAGSANDAFIIELGSLGYTAIYSTYLGGSGEDNGHRITLDSAGNVYVTGDTTSTNFPTKNAIQSVSGGGKDAFVTKINSSGSALVDSTYLGGSGDDYGNGIAVDNSGAVYVAGGTNSTNLPTANPLQVANGGGDSDAFITKLIPGGPQVKIIESVGSTNVAESGTTDTYTVVLTNQPTANVAIALNTGTEIKPIAGISFTPTNWFLPQTVTVSAVDDAVAETSPQTGPIAHTAISTDANYNGATASFTVNGTAGNTVNANITDNDTAGVTITPATTTATEGGANGSYSVTLNTPPIAPVTINVATGSQIQPIAALNFTATNWNVAQTVAVAAVDDNLVEGNHAGAIAHTATSTDVKYNGVTIGGVNVAITDNDTAGFSVAPTNITATEGGATGSYKIQLTAQPTAPVTISFNTGSQISPIATPITFDSTNWNVAKTVTVTAIDDNLAQGTHSGTIAHTATSTDANYNAKAIPDVTASITDNDSPGVSIVQSAGSTNIAEGGATATYGVLLTSAPTANVTINFDAGTQISTIAPITFTPTNWNVAQNVTVSAIDNSINEDTHSGTITHTSVSTDTKYNNRTISPVTATIADNDTAGVSVSPASTTATEGGVTGSYTLKLNSQPTAPVTLSFEAESQISAIASVSFDSTNWNVAKSVTVTATDDAVVEGNHAGSISHSAASADSKYSAIAIGGVNVAITDNDTAPTPTPVTPTPTPVTPTPTPVTPTPTPVTPTPTPTPVTPTPTPVTPTPTPVTPTPTPVTPTPTPVTPTPTPTPVTPTPTPVTPTPTPVTPTPTPVTPTPTPVTPTPTPVTPTPTPVGITDNKTLWCGLEKGLDKLENIVNEQLNVFKLPILGRLSGISPNFISDFKNSLVNTVKNATDFTPSQLENSIQEVVGSAFDVKVESSSNPNDTNLVIKIGKKYQLDNINFSEDLGLPALGLKVKKTPKPGSQIFAAPTGNLSRFANLSNEIEASNINSTISDSDTLAPVIDSGNVSRFSSSVPSQAAISPVASKFLNLPEQLPNFDYELSIGVGYNKDFGCYIDTDNTKLNANFKLALPEKFKAQANLAFLQAEFTDDPENPTQLDANFEVKLNDLDNLGGTDDGNRLTLPELDGSYQLEDLFQSSLTSNANLGLHGKTSIDGDAAFPSFDFDLAVNWPLINYRNGQLKNSPSSSNSSSLSNFNSSLSSTANFSTFSGLNQSLGSSNSNTGASSNLSSFLPSNNQGNIASPTTDNPFAGLPNPKVEFNNLKLDLGTFITNLAKPILTTVSDIIDPFRPIIDFLNTDTKLLSELGVADSFDNNRDGQVSILELATKFSNGNVATDFLNAVIKIDEISQLANSLSNSSGNIAIDLGSYSLGDINVTKPNSSLKNKTPILKNSVSDISQQINSKTGGNKKDFVNKFKSVPGIDLPILTKPETAIQLLLGKPDVVLFTYDMPELGLDFNFRKEFPIFGPISGLLEANFNASAHLAFGYDTYGLKEWKDDEFDASSAYKVLDGFYVSDRANPDGTGADVDELKINAAIKAGVGVNAVVASLYGTAGIEGSIGIDLVDIGENNGTSDGKIRGSEIGSRISKPWELFDISGQVNAFLGLEFQTIVPWEFWEGKQTVWKKDFATFELAKFGTGESSRKSGSGVNSYLTGAKVFFDANFNGIPDEKEPFTISNVDGSFNLDVSLPEFDKNNSGELEPDEGRLVVTDGINTATYLPQQTPLTATPDATVVTPLTTLMEKLVAQGINLNEAETKVKAAFGVSPAIDLTSYDPLQAITQNDSNGLAVYAVHIQVQNAIVLTTNLISGGSNIAKTEIADRLISTIANQIQSGALDLTNPAQLQTVIQSAATQLQAQTASNLAPEVAKIIAEGNQRVWAIASSNLPLADAATKIAKVQQVEQGEVAKDLQQVAIGSKTIQEVIAENTGTSLDAQIQSATVNNPTIRQSVNSDSTPAQPSPDSGIELVNNSPNQKIGTDGDDTLGGDSSDDVFSGKKGNDLIFGFNGNDWINGNQGNDLINGGFGDDTLYGGKGIDTITGSDGGDIIFGNLGDDILEGSTGNDTVRGGKGNDLLIGGDGDDFLSGEMGDDTLLGGIGSDRFLLSIDAGIDTVADFEDGKDLLTLASGVTFSQLAITESNGITQISLASTGKVFASLTGVSSSLIGVADFASI